MRHSSHRASRSCDYFNPRIPYGMRPEAPMMTSWCGVFQSTHPVWDATRQPRRTISSRTISIHASRMGCDVAPVVHHVGLRISIHASRMGCDPSVFTSQSFQKYFNPRIPYGMRLLRPCTRRQASEFQSTHPVWDATGVLLVDPVSRDISIHASRMGCDTHGVPAVIPDCLFQSTHPVWDATIFILRLSQFFEFQSTHPVWDATIVGAVNSEQLEISIHASRMGCDQTSTSR